jgi:D-alanyl-lipoteichoic acid acyltransferase DltB (MBOAT superfamily)
LQAKREYNYDQAVDGCRQILWGMFKKIVVADNCAIYVDQVWGDIAHQSGSTLVLAAILYSFQMYADFSGYSDMAIGVGKLIGFKIAKNFNYPFFALNVADFWRRWHMSLTSWLTDYVFMPLNIKFRDWGNWGMILAIIINMVVVGMWHGANWTFAVFGLYHGLLFVPLILSGAFFKKAKLQTNRLGLPVLKDFGQIVLTFTLVTIGLMIFRADNVPQVWEYICGICDMSLFSKPYLYSITWLPPMLLWLPMMIIVEWRNRNRGHGLDIAHIAYKWQLTIYVVLAIVVFAFGATSEKFIYFQF